MANNIAELIALLRNIDSPAALSAALYPLRKAWAEAGWTDRGHRRSRLQRWYAFRQHLAHPLPARWPHEWMPIGEVRYITPTDRGATLTTTGGSIEIVFFAADLVQVRYLPVIPPEPPVPYAISRPLEAWPPPAYVTVQTPDAYLLISEELIVGVRLENGAVFYASRDLRLLRADASVAFGARGAIEHRTALAADEHFFGLGERATPWNRRGQSHILWNTDPAGYRDGDDPINLNIPVYVSVSEAGSYLVFYENPFYAEFDLDARQEGIARHRFAGGELRTYLAVGSPATLLERYTELTGRHPLQPLWMLGYQQSRWSYYPEARVRKLAADFRAHCVPCDAIHLDIDYMDGYRVFTCDTQRFPDLAKLADDLRQQGIKLVTIIDPGVKKDPRYTVYRSGLKGHHFCSTPDGKVFHGPVWPGPSAFPDFTSASSRAWWGQQYESLIKAGIAGFWNDMNEPITFASRPDRTLPNTVQHALDGRGGDHREAHNLYGMLMARATAEGITALNPDKRPVVITRAGWAGVQRYATSWTGDNQSTWESLRLTIPMMLGLGLSGVGFTGADVGGFGGIADGELFTRWVQMGAFLPFFRAHTVKGSPDQEPWAYGEPFLTIIRRFIELRYELLPYLYTAAWQMSKRGWPVVRPLWWREPNRRDLWDIDDAFLCGDALLVAPIGQPASETRQVSLPSGAWYDFWLNTVTPGDQTVTSFAPLETLPLFVREGTVLPLGEVGVSVENRKDRFLRLWFYPLVTRGESVSELYEDTGEGMGYAQGESRLNRFRMRQHQHTLMVTWEREGPFTPPYEHIELTLHGLQRAPRYIKIDGISAGVVAADPVRHSVLLGTAPFESLEVGL